MSLLMPSRPIVINPDLAYSIGLNEAIALQQVNYWLKETTSGLERDGVRWIYNTNEQWLEQFPHFQQVLQVLSLLDAWESVLVSGLTTRLKPPFTKRIVFGNVSSLLSGEALNPLD